MDRRRASLHETALQGHEDTADPESDRRGSDGDGETGADVGATEHDGSPGEDTELDLSVPSQERLVAEAVGMAATTQGGGPDFAKLVDRFWRLVPDEELVGRTAAEMVAATMMHRDLAQQRLPGETKLRIDQGSEGEHTVLFIVTDDMPFLVDSVTAAMSDHGLEVNLLVHPQVVVRRAALGALTEIRPGVEPDEAGPGDLVESWMRVEIGRLHDQAAVTALRNELRRVLTDVREAVEDWPRMRTQALALADELATAQLPVPDKDITDSVRLLRWLADDHFTFLGYREYRLADSPSGETVLDAVLGTGLGILRRDPTTSRVLSSLSPEAYQRVMEKRLLIITKANSRSTVHRAAYLDYIGFKTFDADGNVAGERRFLGLFTSAAYLTSVRELPVMQRKVAEVIERSGLSLRGHSGRDLIGILEDYPREELFQISTDDLFRTVMGVLRLAGRRQVRLFARKDLYGRFISCLVYLPRDRYTTANRLKIQEILLRELHGIGLDYTTRVTEAVLARIHFIVRTDPTAPPAEIDADALSAQIADATRLWDEDFQLLLERNLGEEHGGALFATYRDALPETYKDSHSAREAAQDLAKLELLDEPGQLVLHLFRRRKNGDDVRFKVFRRDEPIILSDVLPMLHSLGVRVEDERPYQLRRAEFPIYIYDFGLALPAGSRDLAEVRSKVENAFAATWRGEAEVDRFNELVLLAGLTWRQVVVLRAYAKYLRQTGTVFSQEYMESTFVAHPRIAAGLVQLFETRLDPHLGLAEADREQRSEELVASIHRELDAVALLDQDRILRSYLGLIQATLRTTFFQRLPVGADGAGRPKSYVAVKLDPQAIADLPDPRPRYEIFVYSPRFEGVHLRFGPVARGGLRWSDRREDFRTEVLGLVKAQMVKNAVIVPVGAKGGFVLKQAPPSTDREALAVEGVACYRQFISALLDITDNLVGGAVVPPADVVRHDGDDPYLVVAADKGTATFSDIANEISLANGFWLGDAFASGGSAGYDHKKMGITARGAWESVKRHFRELMSGSSTISRELMSGSSTISRELMSGSGTISRELASGTDQHRRELVGEVEQDGGDGRLPGRGGGRRPGRRTMASGRADIPGRDFTVVGIGDMSGDVFGNGVLRSRHILLVAAFDHRHVFVDPSPDAERSYLERQRLFNLPRSSWDDYDRSLISEGGGVWPRTVKVIPVSEQMRQAIGIEDPLVTSMLPAELIKAILQAPVDLLWNGGIGTFVKAAGESHADVGDKSNDAIRINGGHIRAKIVGEGGNLGLTQRGRIEYALAGGQRVDGTRHAHICTDFIDNSAGVDCSDHEVNIKILLGGAVSRGELSGWERDSLLEAMTEEVAELVLRDNYDQANMLGLARAQAGQLITVHQRMINEMEQAGQLDRNLEALPTDEELQARRAAGVGLTSPELAVLLAHTKIILNRDINESSLPDEPWTREVLLRYFPEPLRTRYPELMPAHPLRREIITTSVVNEVVNRGGISFVFRANEETGAGQADVIRAFIVVREVFGLAALWRAVEELDVAVPPAGQTALLLEVRRLVDRGVRWLVTNRRPPIDVTAEIERLRPGVAKLLPELAALFRGREREALRCKAGSFVAQGIPAELSDWATRVMYGFGLLDVVEVARAAGNDLGDVASVYFVLSERFQVDELLSKISALPREDRWQAMARMALRYDLYSALAALTVGVLGGSDPSAAPEDRVASWEQRNAGPIARTRNAIREFSSSQADLAALSVLLRQIRTLVRASAD